MTQEIKESIGVAISQDTENLLSQFQGNFESIDSNFNSLRERKDDLENRLVQTVTQA